MFEGRHAADNYHLRLHRARSVVLTSGELVEIRAAQRTFEGAYMRTALGQFSFALIVLKIFTAEFYSIGALFAVYGAGILFTSWFRRHQGIYGHHIPMRRGLDGGRCTSTLACQLTARQGTNSSSPRLARTDCIAKSSEPAAMWSRS
jgi:hypothetical protein